LWQRLFSLYDNGIKAREENHMLGANMKTLRKRKGYSQETLAEQLHVVRQTISKWENGTSVPDAEMLNRISELFEVPVSELLGNSIPDSEENPDIGEVAKQLAILNEQLANQASRRRKIIKRASIGIGILVFLMIAVYIFCFWAFRIVPRQNAKFTRTAIECELDGEIYSYEVIYDQNFQIHEEGGDAWITDHIVTEQYEDANVLLAQIEDYFTDRGGTYRIVDEE
jgi:transcriptional regulator with XRE-family HTH domain